MTREIKEIRLKDVFIEALSLDHRYQTRHPVIEGRTKYINLAQATSVEGATMTEMDMTYQIDVHGTLICCGNNKAFVKMAPDEFLKRYSIS